LREIEIDNPGPEFIAQLRQTANERGLQLKTMALAKYPGSTHVHLRKPNQKGTLEITYWPKAGRAWIAIREDRSAPWMVDAIGWFTTSNSG
jgi:hypothetical protein